MSFHFEAAHVGCIRPPVPMLVCSLPTKTEGPLECAHSSPGIVVVFRVISTPGALALATYGKLMTLSVYEALGLAISAWGGTVGVK